MTRMRTKGRFDVYLQAFPKGGRKVAVSPSGGKRPMWSHDGRTLYYLNGENALMAVSMETSGANPRVGTPVRLFAAPHMASDIERSEYFPLTNGNFIFNVAIPDPTPPALNLLLNWPAAIGQSPQR